MKKLLFGTTINAAATDAGLLALRLFTGLALAIAHGSGKLPPPARFVATVESMGFPEALYFAWAAALAEAIGGILLVVGLATRPAALLILITMATAGFIRHATDPFATKEKALLFAIIALLFVLAGAGRYSIDAMLQGRSTSGRRRSRS